MINPDDIADVAPDGLLRFRGQMFRCALGRAGVSANKREGDGATPSGLLMLERVLYRADRGVPPQAAVRREPLAPTDGWCDDEHHADYNRQITTPHDARHEALWRDDNVYDVIGVLDWNKAPIVRGRGSAIFLHIARPGLAPTEGCIALPQRDLRTLLAQGLRAFHFAGG